MMPNRLRSPKPAVYLFLYIILKQAVQNQESGMHNLRQLTMRLYVKFCP